MNKAGRDQGATTKTSGGRAGGRSRRRRNAHGGSAGMGAKVGAAQRPAAVEMGRYGGGWMGGGALPTTGRAGDGQPWGVPHRQPRDFAAARGGLSQESGSRSAAAVTNLVPEKRIN